MKINLNETITCYLTEEGERILKEDSYGRISYDYSYNKETKELNEQLWTLMHIFGDRLYNGCPQLIVDNDIEIKDEETKVFRAGNVWDFKKGRKKMTTLCGNPEIKREEKFFIFCDGETYEYSTWQDVEEQISDLLNDGYSLEDIKIFHGSEVDFHIENIELRI